MQQESTIEAIKNIMKMLDITPEQLQNNSQSTSTEKNYTILEFKGRPIGSNDDITILKENGYYGSKDDSKGSFSENEMLYIGACVKSGHFEIYKIKRNSDGTIFTLGDLILDPISSKEMPITKFVVIPAHEGQLEVQCGTCSLFDINNLPIPERKKEPILVTESLFSAEEKEIIKKVAEKMLSL